MMVLRRVLLLLWGSLVCQFGHHALIESSKKKAQNPGTTVLLSTVGEKAEIACKLPISPALSILFADAVNACEV